MGSKGQIVDPFGGREDIKNKIIRCVGEPERRFSEDALRIIRALRFAFCLEFEIEENTKRAIREKRELLSLVAGERIFAELCKLLLGDGVLSVLLEYSSELGVIIPELLPCVGLDQKNPYHIYTVYEHIARSVAASPKEKNIRLCMLFHDIEKPRAFFVDEKGVGHFYGHPEMSQETAENILRRLKADADTVKKVSFLVKYHDTRPSATKKSLHKYLMKVGFEGARELLSVRRADLSAQSPEFFSQFEYLSESERIIDELEKEGVCLSVQDLLVNGNDLIELGIEKGKKIGEVLYWLLGMVVAGQVKNEREQLLSLARRKV